MSNLDTPPHSLQRKGVSRIDVPGGRPRLCKNLIARNQRAGFSCQHYIQETVDSAVWRNACEHPVGSLQAKDLVGQRLPQGSEGGGQCDFPGGVEDKKLSESASKRVQ